MEQCGQSVGLELRHGSRQHRHVETRDGGGHRRGLIGTIEPEGKRQAYVRGRSPGGNLCGIEMEKLMERTCLSWANLGRVVEVRLHDEVWRLTLCLQDAKSGLQIPRLA